MDEKGELDYAVMRIALEQWGKSEMKAIIKTTRHL